MPKFIACSGAGVLSTRVPWVTLIVPSVAVRGWDVVAVGK